MAFILFHPHQEALSSNAFQSFKLMYFMSFSAMCAVGIAAKHAIEVTYRQFVNRESQVVESEKQYREAYRNLQTEMGERRQAQKALAENEEKYRLLFERSTDAIFLVDIRTGQYLDANRAAEKLTGRSIDELKHLTTHDVSPRGSVNRLEKLNGSNETIELNEVEYVRPDGSVRTALVDAVPLPGNIFCGVAYDITEHKQAEREKRSLEERLQRAEKMEALGQMAGGVAHDLNNILGILSGYSELLLMEIPEGNQSREHIEKILESTKKGAEIIQDLLTLARRGVTAADVINLNSVVSGFLKTPVFERIKNDTPHIHFRWECDKQLLNIKGSSIHMEKTVMNLVSNAVEAISGNGEVVVRTENRYLDTPVRGYEEIKQGDYVVLTVSDTGMGIPAENREKIFEPFYTKKAMGRSGTGLGLAIVWGTVKDHNGYIDMQTEVGKGTTFTLYFPVTREEPIAPQQKKPVEQYMGKGESVLVVDDIAEQRDVASNLLTRLGYEVHAVSSGEEALEYLKGSKRDILVLDMIMAPGIDGLETYQRILEINPMQKAILVSGFSETERVKEAQKLGAGAYVKKPYVMEKIGLALREELLKGIAGNA